MYTLCVLLFFRRESIISPSFRETKKETGITRIIQPLPFFPIIPRRGREIEVVYFPGNKLKWSVRIRPEGSSSLFVICILTRS